MSAVGAAGGHREQVAWPALVIAIPLAFAIVGMALRYVAFATLGEARGFEAFASAICNWDCGWYVGIAETGYDGFPVPTRGNVGNWAFFPLYPMLVGLLLPIAPLSNIALATIVSTLVSIAACLVAWPLLDRRLAAYMVYCAFVLAGPFSIYFTTFLSEPLFLLLTSAVFLALKERRYLAAGVLSALLSATRIVGVFVVFATVVTMLQDHLERGRGLWSFPRTLLARPDLLLAIFISPLGLFAYMLFLHLTMGDGLAFSHVQRAFGRMFANPLLFLWDGFSSLPREGLWPTPRQMSAAAGLVGLVLTAVLVFRRQYGAAVFCLICVVIPIAGGLFSLVRYMAGLAPIVLALATLCSVSRTTAIAATTLLLVSCPFVTLAWIGDHLALV